MKYLVSILMVFLLIGCSSSNSGNSNTPEVIKNKNVPKDSSFDFKLKHRGTIVPTDEGSFTMVTSVDMDSKGNLYLSEQNRTVLKYDNDGKFIGKIGTNGTGPGEYMYPLTSFVSSDKIYVIDAGTQMAVKYGLGGEYVGSTPLNGVIPAYIFTEGDKLAGLIVGQAMVDNKLYLKYSLSLLDTAIVPYHTMWQDSILFDMNDMSGTMDMGSRALQVALGKDGYYFAENSFDRFKIDNYSYDGNLIREIRKSYAKLPYTKEELEEINGAIKEVIKNNPQAAPFAEQMKFTNKYKRAIDEIKVDSKGRLWTRGGIKGTASFDAPLEYDIFEDGVFINKVILKDENGDEIKASQTFVIDNNLLTFNMKTSELKIYTIEN